MNTLNGFSNTPEVFIILLENKLTPAKEQIGFGTVYILLPDFTVVAGYVGDKLDDSYQVDTVDGRSFHRKIEDIFYDEKLARAKKFLKRYKLLLRTGHTPTEAWNSECAEIVDMAVDAWPEEFL